MVVTETGDCRKSVPSAMLPAIVINSFAVLAAVTVNCTMALPARAVNEEAARTGVVVGAPKSEATPVVAPSASLIVMLQVMASFTRTLAVPETAP